VLFKLFGDFLKTHTRILSPYFHISG
jgi:hypothetical protein